MRQFDARASLAGFAASLAILVGIYFGSSKLRHFDPAVTIYAIGTTVAAFGAAFRLVQFCRRPATRTYLRRGWQLIWKGGVARTFRTNPKSALRAVRTGRSELAASRDARLGPAGTSLAAFANNFLCQNFIRRRSAYRWIMHLCLSGGGTLAFAITFPLVFGWVHFESLPENAEVYRAFVFGVGIDQFRLHGTKAFVVFNLLNFAALALLLGLIMAVGRRLTDRGEIATQSFREDFLPLIILGVVTITGLMLTVSYKWLAGRGHSGIGIAHMISVLVLLLYIPFGKLFHMLQRFVSLAVSLHKRARETAIPAACRRCGHGFASMIHVEDLKVVLDQLGFDYRFATATGDVHYQEICPACRRKLLTLIQGRSIGR